MFVVSTWGKVVVADTPLVPVSKISVQAVTGPQSTFWSTR
jgi:hypothetical protein